MCTVQVSTTRAPYRFWPPFEPVGERAAEFTREPLIVNTVHVHKETRPSGSELQPNSVRPLLEVVAEVSRAVDEMWWDALADGSSEAAMMLGDASLGLHRAAIALSSYEAV